MQCVALRLLISLHCTGAKEVKDKDRLARKCEDSLRMSFNIRTGQEEDKTFKLVQHEMETHAGIEGL